MQYKRAVRYLFPFISSRGLTPFDIHMTGDVKKTQQLSQLRANQQGMNIALYINRMDHRLAYGT